MRVESVAWISERKDLLYSFFYLISLINYFYYVKNKSKTAFIISVLLFELSYLSKGVAISLPFVLFAIDYYFERKLTPRLIFEKLIFIIIAFSPKIFKYLIKLELSRIEISIAIAVTLLLCIITFIGIKKLKNQSDIIYSYIFGSIFSGIVFLFLFKKLIKLVPAIDVSFFDRILMANYSLLFYIVKLFLPVNLSALHYYPKKTDGFLPIEYYIAPFIIILLVFLIFKGMKYSDQKLRKNIIFGLLLFLIPISITLHIIPIKGKVIVAERYTYMPYIGLFFIIGSFYCRAENIKKYLLVLLIGYTIFFSITTWNRNKVWADGITLFTDVINKSPLVGYSYFSRANAKRLIKDHYGAISDYSKAIELNPLDDKSYNSRGAVKQKLKDLKGAISDYNKAVKINSDNELFYNNRGFVRQILGDLKEAIEDFDKAIQLNPSYDTAYLNRGNAKQKLNALPAAIADYTKAIEINPVYVKALVNRGNAKQKLKNLSSAIIDYSKAIQIKPDHAKAYFYRARAEFKLGQKSKACKDLYMAKRLGINKAEGLIRNICN
ncbi:protein O-mannosyl-transferase [Candidatus Magnetomoraceae bacterium gMMP-1]